MITWCLCFLEIRLAIPTALHFCILYLYIELATTTTNELSDGSDATFATAKTALQVPGQSFRRQISQERSTSDPAFSHTLSLELTHVQMHVRIRATDTHIHVHCTLHRPK